MPSSLVLKSVDYYMSLCSLMTSLYNIGYLLSSWVYMVLSSSFSSSLTCNGPSRTPMWKLCPGPMWKPTAGVDVEVESWGRLTAATTPCSKNIMPSALEWTCQVAARWVCMQP